MAMLMRYVMLMSQMNKEPEGRQEKMDSKKTLLTVVVPVYNVEKYLGDCLDSLLSQTVVDHKIVVVNDGTNDSSGEIAKNYAATYPELIQYVEQENKGLGAARNTGLELVDTEYVTFLDSDDWWDSLFVEKVKKQLAHHGEMPDIIFTLPWIYDNVSGRVIAWYDKPIFDELFFPDKGGNENAISKTISVLSNCRLFELEANACRRIYRTAFLKQENFAFPVGVKWEDVQPHFHLLKKAKRCIGVRSTGFFYRINTGGQITSGGGASRLDLFTVFGDTLQMAYDDHWPSEDIGYILRMLYSFSTWSIGLTNQDYIGQLLEKLHKLFGAIPKKYFKVYFNHCSPQPKTDFLLAVVMRSPFFRILKDYRFREYCKRSRVKFWKIRDKIRRR